MVRVAETKQIAMLYRHCMKWTKQGFVRKVKFVLTEVPTELAALIADPKDIQNADGVYEAVRQGFRKHSDMPIGQRIDLGFTAHRYLTKYGERLEKLDKRREANRVREGIKFSVGQVVRDQMSSCRGVVVGWDHRPTVDVSGWDDVSHTRDKDDQPFYQVAPDADDIAHFVGGARNVMYLAQENLEAVEDPLERHIDSPLIRAAFKYFDELSGCFVPAERIAFLYPADARAKASYARKSDKYRISGVAPHLDACKAVCESLWYAGRRLWSDLEKRHGDLRRFEEPGKTVVELLSTINIEVPPRTESQVTTSEGERRRRQQQELLRVLQAQQRQRQPGQPQLQKPHEVSVRGKGSQEQLRDLEFQRLKPGFDALRTFYKLFTMTDELYTRRTSCADRRGVEFSVGQIVRHRTQGYRGVVFEWQRFPRVHDDEALGRRPNQPHYKIIVDEADRAASDEAVSPTAVAAQDDLQPVGIEDTSSVKSPLLPEYFEYYDPVCGKFQPNAAVRFMFSADEIAEPSSSEWLNEATEIQGMIKKIRKSLQAVLFNKHEDGALRHRLHLMAPQAMRKEDGTVVENVLWLLWIAHSDDRIRALVDDGVNFIHRGLYDEALRRFDLVVKEEPLYPEGHNKRATALCLMGNFEAALEDLERALKLDEKHLGLLMGKGLCLYKLSNFKEAVQAFRQVLKYHPWASHVGVNLHLARQALEARKASRS